MELTKSFLTKGLFLLAFVLASSFSIQAQYIRISNEGSCSSVNILSGSAINNGNGNWTLKIYSSAPTYYYLNGAYGGTVTSSYQDSSDPKIFIFNISTQYGGFYSPWPGASYGGPYPTFHFRPSGCTGIEDYNAGKYIMFRL